MSFDLCKLAAYSSLALHDEIAYRNSDNHRHRHHPHRRIIFQKIPK